MQRWLDLLGFWGLFYDSLCPSRPGVLSRGRRSPLTALLIGLVMTSLISSLPFDFFFFPDLLLLPPPKRGKLGKDWAKVGPQYTQGIHAGGWTCWLAWWGLAHGES